MKKLKFPKGFLWGGSTSAYQFEGGVNQGGKGLSVQDKNKDNWMPGVTGFEVCSDHYNNWKTDVKMLAELGFKSYRFSIAWSRIIPDGDGNINKEGINFYKNLILELKKYNIEPVVTMYHFDLPLALEKKGGWLSRNTVDAFEKFARAIFNEYKDLVKYWLTINEQNIVVLMSDVIGMANTHSTGNKIKDKWQINHNLLLAQAKAVIACKEICKNALIGPAPNISVTYPNSNKPLDFLAKLDFDMERNWVYLDVGVKGVYPNVFLRKLEKLNSMFDYEKNDMKILKKGTADFIAFNYYNSATIKYKQAHTNNLEIKKDQQSGLVGDTYEKVRNKNLPLTEFNWEIDPEGLRNTLRDIHERYGLPLMITENGIGGYDTLTEQGTINDDYRIKYYQAHITQMALAIDDGVELIGYMPWSAIDLVSTHEGVKKRYGFIFVNRDEFDLKDMKRYKKKSFFWYQNVIKTNGENLS